MKIPNWLYRLIYLSVGAAVGGGLAVAGRHELAAAPPLLQVLALFGLACWVMVAVMIACAVMDWLRVRAARKERGSDARPLP